MGENYNEKSHLNHQKLRYVAKVSAPDYSKYDQLLEHARGSAKYWIPKLCQALREENSEMSNDDIRERVKQDCLPIWQRGTINNALPEEYKNKERSLTGKKGRQKQLEQANGTLTIAEKPTPSWAEDDSDSSTEQESQRFDRPNPVKMVCQLQNQLNSTKQELEEAKRRIATLQEIKNTEDVPGIDNGRSRLVGAEKVTKLGETDKIGCAVFVDRLEELIKRKIAKDGKASIRFFILAKRRSTKVKCLIPVILRVNFNELTTSLILDERRIQFGFN